MTDAERLEKWYAEQNFLPGVKSIFRACPKMSVNKNPMVAN